MEYVCFQQLDITASNINSEYCLRYVHIHHSCSYTSSLQHAMATGFTQQYCKIPNLGAFDAHAEHMKVCI